MGFTPPSTVYVLDFTDTELDGLTVRAAGVPLGTLLELSGLADLAEPATRGSSAAAGQKAIAALGQLIEGFAKVLREWDLQDHNGEDVPADAAGLRTLEMRHVMLLISTWIKAASEVPAPLEQPSTDGGQSVEASLPRATLSSSLAS